MRVSILFSFAFTLPACTGGTPAGKGGGPSPDDYTSTTGPDHCGQITSDEIWAADLNPHTVSCDVYAEGGTLTIAPGTLIQVDSDKGVYVSYYGAAAGFETLGTADFPVVFNGSGADERGTWSGIGIYDAADDAALSIAGTEIDNAGGYFLSGALSIDASTVHVNDLVVSKSEEAGVAVMNGGEFADDSENITVKDSAIAAQMVADTVATFPERGANLSDNDDARVRVAGGTVAASCEWDDPGVPYMFDGDVYVEGNGTDPATLQIGAGSELQWGQDRGLYIGYYGQHAGLWVKGTDADPILFTSGNADEPGAWSGIGAFDATDDNNFLLTSVTINDAGGYFLSGGLSISGATVTAQSVTITNSEEAGFYLYDGAAFSDDSSGIAVNRSAWSGTIDASTASTYPEAGSNLTGNTTDGISITGGTIPATTAWGDAGVDYRITGDLFLEGTADATTVLTLDAGVTLAFGNDRGLYVSYYGGSAGLVAAGTADAPVTFTAAQHAEAGAWSGIILDDAASDSDIVLEHVDIGYAGGYGSTGDIAAYGADFTVRHATIHDSEEYGIYSEDSTPTLEDVSYAHNASGDRN